MKILIVDDNKEITELLKIYTDNEGYESITAYDGQEALDQFADHPDIDLIILDVMMPEKDGIEVVKEIRGNSQVPILMLSAKVSDTDKIKGLVNGADDYVTKPFNPLEVMARVKSLLRRSQHFNEKLSDTKEITVGPLVIDKEGHTVKTDRGEYIQLTALEFGILHLLASHPSRVFSADEIFERVWKQDSVVSSKTVMVHVSHLRDKIAQATDGEQVVETVWGVGYKISSDMVN
ncbi:MAG: response regulator transcription factor [Atopococcus tabaci]|uniref:Response regulator transcription factor n=1 Tax=Atopococcus tabaci TaxID=269774 RepID=A0AA43UDC2_9LACT|nr:response regulator transcription factor [Atopococcus tabaci]